jgi:hypothetical protein
MNRFLAGQTGAHAAGLAAFDPREVEPYEARPVQPIDAALAWKEALAATAHYQGALDPETPAPPHWPQLVSSHEPVVALAFCIGNFPQLVRDFHQVLQSRDLKALAPMAGRPVAAPQLLSWAQEIAAKKQFPGLLVALGALRLAKRFEEADSLIASVDGAVAVAWRPAWDNEKAALAWHRGETAAARELWSRQLKTLPVRFNLAMAELFLGNAKAARTALADIVQELPDASGWHHLARLYLTLAEMR